jgi:hypothetical protein
MTAAPMPNEAIWVTSDLAPDQKTYIATATT